VLKNAPCRLIDFVVDQAEIALSKQSDRGAMPAGCNGPYHNPETPVRNSAHWLITFSWLYRMTRDQRYLDGAEKLAAYLSDPAHRPHGYSFACRQGAMDQCNGLIGQAWAMEGLAEAARLFSDRRYSKIAIDVFNKHKFDHNLGVWQRLEPDGRDIGEDPTFNHQLWFATAAAEVLADVGESDHPVVARFMVKLNDTFTVLGNGHIRHLTYHRLSTMHLKNLAKRPVASVGKLLGINSMHDRFEKQAKHAVLREVGYQCFNIYALARLSSMFADHALFTSQPFRRAIAYLESDDYKAEVEGNPYGYGYNAPGFEVPFCLSVFSRRKNNELLCEAKYWIEKQIRLTYDPRTRIFSRNAEDPETLSARIYELVRSPEVFFDLVVDRKMSEQNIA